MQSTEAQENLAALTAIIEGIETQRDNARQEAQQSQEQLTTAQAEVARLSAELETARRMGSAGIDISALTENLSTARENLARAEAQTQWREQHLDQLSENLNEARRAAEFERNRRETVLQELADERVASARAEGRAETDLARAEGENRLVTEQSRRRWPWWLVLLACLVAFASGYACCKLCGPCAGATAPVQPASETPTAKVEPEPVPVPATTVDPTPPAAGGRPITIGTAAPGDSGCCGRSRW